MSRLKQGTGDIPLLFRSEKFAAEATDKTIPRHILDAYRMSDMVLCMTNGNPNRMIDESLYDTCIQYIIDGNVDQAEAAAEALQGVFRTNITHDISVYRRTMALVADGLLKEAGSKAKNEFAILDLQTAVCKKIKQMTAQGKKSKPPKAGPQTLSA